MVSDSISLYVHIPFCTRKCDYCHFYVIPDKDSFKEKLRQGLRKEWKKIQPLLKGKKVVSLYFGGGTPALFGPEAIGEVIDWVGPTEEVTLEANPENINKPLMKAFARVGVNRVSIGIQALDDNLLKVLSRQHTAQEAINSVNTTYDAGISNISIDLMYELPEQTFQLWQETLRKAVALPITHLSLYNLTIEPHTVFYKHREKLQKKLPNAESSLNMYQEAMLQLDTHGYKQYEISAFAKEMLISQHNIGYWTGRPFLGLGPSAYSYWEGKQRNNWQS